MRNRIIVFIFTLVITAGSAIAQSSWLDRPLNNWNNGNGVVPNAPRTFAPIPSTCRGLVRNPESIADRAVTRAGWSLFGASQTYGPATVISGMAGTDGMCRPTQYNTFVFVNDRFAGTLAPAAMDARTDGSLTIARLIDPNSIVADFSRYTSSDALCCPSQTSTVSYTITSGNRPAVKAETVATQKICQDGGEVTTQDNVISGTVTYRQRTALPATAVLILKLVDVSRADASGTTISEQRVEIGAAQVPINFDLTFERSRIVERNRYAIQAEIRDGSRLLFITDTSYPVVTQGNPRNVEITVVPVGGGGQGFPGVRENVIKGTVSYLQRIALARNSEVTVRLFDAETPDGPPVAETKFPTTGKQSPFPFELRFESRDVSRQRNYELRAEIKTAGQLKFRSAAGQPVNLRGNQIDPVELIVAAATDESVGITGNTLSLSKFGTGSLKVGDGGSQFLIQGGVEIMADGSATVTFASLNATTTFSGKLTYFDTATARITVENSSGTDASGVIEIKYSGRRLNSITATNLKLNGQNVTLRF